MAKKAILLVEDESMLAKALNTMLLDSGFEVKIVNNGSRAIEEVDNNAYDLVLLDLVVPGVDGFEVLHHIRKKDHKTPIFILSNLSSEDDKKKAKDMGVDKYFVKSETLLSELTTHINSLIT